MTKRMTADAFMYLKNTFPNEFEQMECLEIEVSRFDMFRSRKKKKTNKDRYGDQLAAILEWLDNNCNEPYFPKFESGPRSSMRSVFFYFVEPTDAVAFKLMFK